MKLIEEHKDKSIYSKLANILRIANTAVTEAKEENRKQSIPETFWKGGKLYYLLITGELTVNRPKIMS